MCTGPHITVVHDIWHMHTWHMHTWHMHIWHMHIWHMHIWQGGDDGPDESYGSFESYALLAGAYVEQVATCIHASMHACIHTCLCACMHTYMPLCTYASIHASVHICAPAHARMRVYVHTSFEQVAGLTTATGYRVQGTGLTTATVRSSRASNLTSNLTSNLAPLRNQSGVSKACTWSPCKAWWRAGVSKACTW